MPRTPEEKAWFDQMKAEAAKEVGVTPGKGSTARQNGQVGGQMVKKMIEFYKNSATKE